MHLSFVFGYQSFPERTAGAGTHCFLQILPGGPYKDPEDFSAVLKTAKVVQSGNGYLYAHTEFRYVPILRIEAVGR